MKKYARIQNGFVAEVIAIDGGIADLFHPELTWVEILGELPIAESWRYQDGTFERPSAVSAPTAPALSDLQSQINALAAQISALASRS